MMRKLKLKKGVLRDPLLFMFTSIVITEICMRGSLLSSWLFVGYGVYKLAFKFMDEKHYEG